MDNDDHPKRDDPSSGLRERIEGYVPDFVRRSVVAGVGSLLLNEEGVKGLVSDLKLPAEVTSAISSQAEKSKSELSRIIAAELRQLVENMNIWDEMHKVISGYRVHVEMDIKFEPRDGEDEEKDGDGVASSAEDGPEAGKDQESVGDEEGEGGSRHPFPGSAAGDKVPDRPALPPRTPPTGEAGEGEAEEG